MLLHQARTAPDGDAALEYMQRAVDLGPDDPRVQSSVQLSMFNKLRADAFVAFLAETGNRYVITFRNSRPFTVPKARKEPEPYPPASVVQSVRTETASPVGDNGRQPEKQPAVPVARQLWIVPAADYSC